MDATKKRNFLIALVTTELILAAVSMSLAWYKISTNGDPDFYFIRGYGADDSLAKNVSTWLYLWLILGWILLLSVVVENRTSTLLFGWLAMAASVVTIAYFVSEAVSDLSPGDFIGSGFGWDPEVRMSWGPAIGWYMAVVAAAVQTAVVLILMYDLFAKEQVVKYEGPFGESGDRGN